MELRDYQRQAIGHVHASFGRGRSTLLVLATGLGKTFVASQIILHRKREGRALWIAHTEELIQQAVQSLERVGLQVEVEKSTQHASRLPMSDVVVATVQTLKANRLKSWDESSFKTVVIDEAHHSVSNGYRDIVNHFSNAKILGLTATPERSDKVALGQIFEDVAFQYGIKEGVENGYLANILVREVTCASLDISKVKTVMGDLDVKALSEAVNKDSVLHQICSTMKKEAENRPTLAFFPNVLNAYQAARVMAGYLEDTNAVQVIEGNTPADMRAAILNNYKQGHVQYIFNCAVLTEGFDAPSTSCIAICRPTKSPSLYRQMVGRGTRLAPGKETLLLLDFKGNAGRHSLASAFDIFEGLMTPPEMRLAKSLMQNAPDITVLEAAKLAKKMIVEERARKEALQKESAKVIAEVGYRTKTYSPFGSTMEEREHNPKIEIQHRRPWERPATEKQINALKYHFAEIPDISVQEASRLFVIVRNRRPSQPMIRTLQRFRYKTDTITYGIAGEILKELRLSGWQETADIRAKYGKYKGAR